VPVDGEALLATFDRQVRMSQRPTPGTLVEHLGNVVRCVRTGPGGWSVVVWSDLTDGDGDEVIAAQLDFYGRRGEPFEWKYYGHDRPDDLPERLRRAGFTPEPEEALMVAEVTEALKAVEPPPGIRVERVGNDEGVDQLVAVHNEVFGCDDRRLAESLRRQLAEDPDSMAMVVARAGEQVVCVARIEFQWGTDFASLWGGGTLPEWRGVGIYRALVAYRAHLAAERGFRYLQVDALPDSQPILGRLGFAVLSTTVPFASPTGRTGAGDGEPGAVS
jgi:ribosomal protein S18 acetylase RimI-like enzyme